LLGFIIHHIYNLAGVLRDQVKYEEAEEMHRRTVLGEAHPYVLTSMSKLTRRNRFNKAGGKASPHE